MRSAEDVLAKLTIDTAVQWQVVGEVLFDLESISGVAPTGDTWQEVVAERLVELGHPVTQGHLYKVRRSFAFAALAMDFFGLSRSVLARAKIGAVELAERLYRLDMEAGHDALRACVDQENPATASEVKKRYESFLENHPERRNSKQVAWQERKKVTTQDNQIAVESGATAGSDKSTVETMVSDPHVASLRGQDLWMDVLQPVIMRMRDLELILRGRDEHIKLLEEENEELRREIREARQHEQLALEAMSDARAELMWSRK